MKNNYLLIANVSPLEDENLFNKAYNQVSSYRHKVVDRYRFSKDKCLSLATEILLKYGFHLLNQEINLEEIEYNNKPRYHGKYHFNFSHSGQYTICAISLDEVGCDIEVYDKANLKIAKRFFHENEYQRLLNTNDSKKQRKLFYDYWTAKEAFVKNLGTGIRMPLDSFEICMDDKITIKQSINKNKYYFKNIEMEGYSLTFCGLNDEDIKIIYIDLKEIV